MLFDTVCIAGVGLIGGSFGLAVRERGLARRIVGLVRREESAQAAQQLGVVDFATTDFSEATRGADLILLAPPVGQIKALCEKLAPLVDAGAIITGGEGTAAEKIKAFLDNGIKVGESPAQIADII